MSTKLIATEGQEQRAFKKWCDATTWNGFKIGEYLIAIENGGSRQWLEAINLKRAGQRVGASDLLLALPANGSHGLFIEMKRRENYKISIAQQEFLQQMRRVGYGAVIALGWEHAVELTKKYLTGEPH